MEAALKQGFSHMIPSLTISYCPPTHPLNVVLCWCLRQHVFGFFLRRSKVHVKIRITHAGEVNKARHCPYNKFWVATKSPDPHVFVFDWSKMPSEPDKSGEIRPLYLL